MKPQTSRRFAPIFVAKITPSSIETKVSENGAEYLLCTAARFERSGRDPQTRTVMAFGHSVDKVRSLLTAGKAVELAVQFDGGTVKVVGPPRPKQIAAERSRMANKKPMPEQLLLACIDAAGYDQNDRYAQSA